MTENITPIFTVKESANGKPWVSIEYSDSNQNFPAGLFGFSLHSGATLAEAQRLAKLLGETISEFTHTA